MKKNVGISNSKGLKSAEKNRRANQTARAILTAPTVQYRYTRPYSLGMSVHDSWLIYRNNISD